MNDERARLLEAREDGVPWRRWGPYLSERQWGTVREDYSDTGNAWDYFTHDQARSRAYRRGEDGLAGVCDDHQTLCFALALWNGRDPILKERLFGLTNSEGNHGEDVKEYYYYLDSTPTHSYMRYLYKYPHAAYPYNDLVQTSRRRTRHEMEYELIDTGVFNEGRYFDVFVEYAKAGPEDLLIRIDIRNRGPDRAELDVLPTLWFRNTWSWGSPGAAPRAKPSLRAVEHADARVMGAKTTVVAATHEQLGPRWWHCDPGAALLFTDNETNHPRFGEPNGKPNSSHYYKDAFHAYLCGERKDAVNPDRVGTKCAAHYHVTVASGGQAVIRLRLTDASPTPGIEAIGPEFDRTFEARRADADEFYGSVVPENCSPDEHGVIRQALSGMLWSKQFYSFNLFQYLSERGAGPAGSGGDAKHEGNGNGRVVRNREWFHMVNEHVISMPDKWEYPWYAAWDLAFHTGALAMVDLDFAKDQLDLMLGDLYLHPNGQIPAYEWNFSDVNPPVHAWATVFLHRIEKGARGQADYAFLERMFGKLMMNFTWWVNRKDRDGNNVFQGGFLGLDNIGVFDRSAPLPTGGYLEQADGTAWMALFCQNMLEIGVELASVNSSYDDLSVKYAEHLLWIASALNRVGKEGMWDETDGFYYDVLRLPDGSSQRLKVRSMVGLLPLCASTVAEPWQRERVPRVLKHLHNRFAAMPWLRDAIHWGGVATPGCCDRLLLSIVDERKLRRILGYLLDEREFLSPFGIRSLSRYHLDHPFIFNAGGQEYRVGYLPAESDTGLFGGNSNWRGPVWFPVNMLILRSLLQYYLYYGDNFTVECPTGSGRQMNLFEVAREIGQRLANLFLRDADGRRPVFGQQETFQQDAHFRDYPLFYEYFHGDNGAGIGASHQTGWTGLVAPDLLLLRTLTGKEFLAGGRAAVYGPAIAAPPLPPPPAPLRPEVTHLMTSMPASKRPATPPTPASAPTGAAKPR